MSEEKFQPYMLRTPNGCKVCVVCGHISPPWTSDPPTEPGWYWWKACPKSRFRVESEPEVVFVENCHYEGTVYFHGEESSLEFRYIAGQWAGPLAPPPG